MIRRTIFALATVAGIAAAALIPTEASAGGGKRWWNGWRISRPRRSWLLWWLRRHRGDRTELLAVGPGLGRAYVCY